MSNGFIEVAVLSEQRPDVLQNAKYSLKTAILYMLYRKL